VLMDPDTGPKLADFGIAAVGPVEGEPGVVWGTPGYVAPELLRGAPPSEQTEVYGAGALLFFMLAGRAPVTVGAQRAPSGRAPTVASFGVDVPADVEAVVAAGVDPGRIVVDPGLGQRLLVIPTGVPPRPPASRATSGCPRMGDPDAVRRPDASPSGRTPRPAEARDRPSSARHPATAPGWRAPARARGQSSLCAQQSGPVGRTEQKSFCNVNSPIFACSAFRSTAGSLGSRPPPKTDAAPSSNCAFQAVIWFGWTSNCSATPPASGPP